MGKRHRWGGVIADAEGYVRQSAAAARGGRERRRRTVKAAGGGRGVYGVVMMFFFSACALKMNPLSTWFDWYQCLHKIAFRLVWATDSCQ